MTKSIAVVLALVVVGCTATTPPPGKRQSEKGKQAKARPSLDRTYDWGARPPVANPEREKD
jgi:hypothetical protein